MASSAVPQPDWEMQTSAGWVDAPFKAPAGGGIAGKKAEFKFQGVDCTVKFQSDTNAEVQCKDKTYPARVKPSFEPPARVPEAAADAADEMNIMKLFDSLANDGAVKPKEFALMLRLEGKALLRNQFNANFAVFAEMEENPLGLHKNTLKQLVPVVKRAIDRFDLAHSRKLLEMVFRVMDGNQNGQIEKAEFEEFIGSAVQLAAAPDPNAAGDFAFKLVDKNGNGKLSLDEAQGLIDSLVEVAATVVTGVADIAESVITSPETATALRNEFLAQASEEGMVVGKISACCDETQKALNVGDDWYHKKDTGDDLCKEAYDAYTGEDKAQYFLVDSVEKIKADKCGTIYRFDPNAIVDREGLAAQLQAEGIYDGLAAVFADNSEEGPKAQMVKMVKMLREALGKAESNIGAQFYMKAMEWSQGGVDESTFLCQVVPMMRDAQNNEMEKLKAHPAETIKEQMATMTQTGALPVLPAQQSEMANQVIQMLIDSGEFVPALERGQLRAQEYNGEIARAFFHFLDLDGSGRITTQEIRLLKALLNALLHLGERACHELADGEVKPMEGSVSDNASELAFAIFDILDKDSDGQLSMNECIAFCQKFAVLALNCFKYIVHSQLECVYDEVFKALASIAWKQQGIEEVGKDQIMQGLMMAPMMFGMMMAQMQ